ncbi:MAG: DUF2203 family protein [Nitrospinaceae bacterium]|nr:DUF2203 domain-containing protein [Nitrospinaceae bacterium]NIR53307.1 DUF2203 domain-containing protein [Nitrospinaceae bacterium]NIS83705.1 DUF2203 domain-containing protein [Nitrospinaceae bacterium]NIT80501.1 DUF2203 domain-containing protein [Nitrospinaceae bacterium]NIU42829.1 DUF2203 domain-containing protein [Nitrospinaceae bacterium]
MSEPKRYFTVEEANAHVPRLLELVPQIQDIAARLNREFPDVRNAWEKAKFNGGSSQGTAYLAAAQTLTQMVKDLESIGCVVKGVKEGLVDFPALRDGKEVYLCWKVPEKEIRYWHDIQAGFAGRQPI